MYEQLQDALREKEKSEVYFLGYKEAQTGGPSALTAITGAKVKEDDYYDGWEKLGDMTQWKVCELQVLFNCLLLFIF